MAFNNWATWWKIAGNNHQRLSWRLRWFALMVPHWFPGFGEMVFLSLYREEAWMSLELGSAQGFCLEITLLWTCQVEVEWKNIGKIWQVNHNLLTHLCKRDWWLSPILLYVMPCDLQSVFMRAWHCSSLVNDVAFYSFECGSQLLFI